MSGKYKNAVDTSASKVQGAQVVIVTDSHLYGDKVQDYAFDLGRKLGKPVGLEALGPWHQPFVDAMARGDISKKEFLNYIKPEDNPSEMGGVRNYIGKAREDKYYQKIADEVASGTTVYCLGTAHGKSDALTNVEVSKAADKVSGNMGQMELDYIMLEKMDVHKRIEKDPKGVFRQFSAEFEKGYDKLTPLQQEAYVSIKMQDNDGAFKDKADYQGAIKGLYFAQHPLYDETKKLDERISNSMKSGVGNPDFQKNGPVLYRQAADADIIAPKIAELSRQDSRGMVVMYGTHHTEGHDNDIDGSLRGQGLSVAVLDPVVPRDQVVDPSIVGSRRQQFLKSEDEIQNAARQSGDPNRYTVQLTTGQTNEIPSSDQQRLKVSAPVMSP